MNTRIRSTVITNANAYSNAVYGHAGRLAARLTTDTPDEQLRVELATLQAVRKNAELAELAIRIALRGPVKPRGKRK